VKIEAAETKDVQLTVQLKDLAVRAAQGGPRDLGPGRNGAENSWFYHVLPQKTLMKLGETIGHLRHIHEKMGVYYGLNMYGSAQP
jgi:hypothetical protein